MITLYNEKNEKVKLISAFEFNDADMGESSISATVSFDKEQDFHPDWYVEYNKEKFRLGVRKPTGKKDTSSLSTSYTLVFKSEREDLKRYTFMDFVELGTGNPQPNSYKVPLYATLSEFVHRFNVNLNYYMGSRWRMVLPSNYSESGNAVHIVFDNITLWDVLLKIHETWGVRWKIVPQSDVLNIQVGFPDEEIEHVFEYGKDNGLVSVERNNALERIITRLRGRGGERNLPPDYFHSGDPDTNAFLQATYFQNLMPKSYRDYIKGYNSGSGSGSWAYNQGVADKRAGVNIAPVDYAVSSKESLWGVSYGAIEPNESIYPTLQGASRNGSRLDTVIDVEEVFADSPAIESDRETESRDDIKITSQGICLSEGNELYDSCLSPIVIQPGVAPFVITKPFNTIDLKFKVESLYKLLANLDWVSPAFLGNDVKLDGLIELYNTDSAEVVAKESIANTPYVEIHAENIPEGIYAFKIRLEWIAENQPAGTIMTCNFLFYDIKVDQYSSATTKEGYKSTFDIWIKDIWNEPRQVEEKDEDYIYRVWERLAVSEEMTVMFSDGLLAGEDYEFRVVGVTSSADNLRSAILSAIHLDDTKSLFGERSAWRLTLQKSEAELEASGRYLPNRMQQAKPGNHFFFVNIAMPYNPYVYDAEARVQSYLDTQLALKDEEYPSFTISPSPIFCKDFEEVGKLKAGSVIRVRNLALIGDSYLPLHIQSITKRYSEKKLNPDWTVTVSDQIVASGNPVETLEGDVNILSSQVYSNKEAVKQAVRQLSTTFLRKDGVADVSYSPSTFTERVKIGSDVVDTDFSRGDVNGKGFGVYTDGDGNRVVEADILVGRIAARFNEVHLNQVTYSGGKQVFSAAGLQVSKVENTGDAWRCYFDNKNGSVKNLFKEGDGAFSQHFTTEGYTSYWRRVVGLGADYIDLSLTDCMENSGDPMVGDSIAQLGNKEDKSRQAALVIDVVREGGGLVTWYDDINEYTLKEKDSVNIGRLSSEIDGETFWKTWLQVFGAAYIGNKEKTQYVHYEDGVLRISGTLEVGTKLSDGRNLEQALKDATPEGYEDFVKKVLGDLENLQGQVDGAIESFFYEYEPTLNNYPAIEWNTDELKIAHLNDTFTNLKDGRSWRWTKSGDVYGWTEITDTATVEALRLAGLAKDTADGKRRIFTTTPTVNSVYDEGDLWVNATYGELYYNDILRANTAKKAGVPFSIDHWELASKYTDDKKAEELFGALEYLKKALQESTLIEGGLIQSSLLALGYTQDGEFKVMSGTNGVYMPAELGGGIAAWYGGPMIDKIAKPEYSTYAQSVFRFDGSGYLAGGNIKWDSEGAGSVAGGGLSWDKYGNVFLGPDIKITSSGDETLGSVLTMLNRISDWFTLQEIDGESFLITRYNIASYGEVSSGGIGSGSSGEGGGGSGVGNILPSTSLAAYGSTEKLTEVFSAYTTKLISDRVGVLEERNPINLSSMWGALASSGSEKIDVSHIPDLSGVYLPLSGGKISAASNEPLLINNTTEGGGSYLDFFVKNQIKAFVGYSSADMVFMQLAGGSYLAVKKDGAYYGNNTLIHSGNISSYNAGSATKLQDDTAFTVWGQIFFKNGKPQSVSGGLSGVDFIKFDSTNTYGIHKGSTFSSSFTESDLVYSAQNHRFYNGNSYAFTIKNNGNVLIGTTTDNGAKLQVNGSYSLFYKDFRLITDSTGSPSLIYEGTSNWAKGFKFLHKGSTQMVQFGAYGEVANNIVDMAYISVGSQTFSSAIIKVYEDRAVISGGISVANKSTLANNLIVYKGSGNARLFVNKVTANIDYAYIYVSDATGTDTNRPLVLQHGYGNVLIGTTTDNGAKLQVNGSLAVKNGHISIPNSYYYYVTDSAETKRHVITLNANNNLMIGNGTAEAGYPTYLYGSMIVFKKNTATELARLDENGLNLSAISTQSITIGGATLTWDAESECLIIDKNLAAYGEVSSGGIGDGSASGGNVNLLQSWSGEWDSSYALSAGLGVDLNNRLVALEANGGINLTSMWNSLTSVDSTKVIDPSHIPDLSNKYLTLSGGILTSANVPLTINRTSGIVTIDYKSNGTTVGYLGFGQDGSLIVRPQVQTNSEYYNVLHTGNYSYVTDKKYLKLSGGKLTKDNFLVLSIENTATDLSVIGFYGKSGLLGHLGFNAVNKPRFMNTDGVVYDIIHSGNIGSQSVAGLINEVLTDLNNGSYGRIFTMTSGYGSTDGNKPDADWVTGITLMHANNPQYRTQLAITSQEKFYLRRENGGTWQRWKEFAFTDSNVASAFKLITDSATAVPNTIFASAAGNNVTFGYDTAKVGFDTYLVGRNITLRIFKGETNKGGIVINNSANVTIGASDLASTTVKLYVSGTTSIDGNLSASGSITLRPSTNLYGSFAMNANRMFIQALHDGVAYLPIALNPSGGNVLIGTTSDDGYKLNVAGTGRFTGLATLSGGLSATTGSFSSTLSVSGKTTLNNVDINANYELVCNGSASFTTIKPISANTYDLGTDFFRWNNAYINTLDLSGNISVGGALSVAKTTTLSGTLSVAKATTLSGTLSVSQLASFHNVEIGSGYSLNCFGNGYFTHIYPQSNNTYNLGSSSAQWNNLFAQNINCATGELNISAKGVINFTNTEAASSSTPTIYAPVITSFYLLAPNGGQIGMSNVRWENVFSKYGDFENSIYIGSARIWWDSENDCLRVSKNFASDGEVSAGGVNSDSSDSDSSNAPVLGGTISGDLDVTGKVTIGGVTTMNSGFLSKSIQVGSRNNDSIGFGNCSIDLYGSLYLNNPTTGKWASFTISDTSETVVINRALSVVSLTQTSDIRFKQVIDDVCLSSKIIANAPMFRFTWADNQDGKVHIGTSAQYWMNYAPELTTLVDNKYTLDYATLGVLMGKSNATEIEQLKERVRILEQEVECYRRMLNAN